MNWIAKTHQRWKMRAGFALLAGSGICSVLGVAAFSKCEGPAYAYCATADRGSVFMLVGAAVGLVSLVWLFLAVRCARCRKSVVWWAMANKAAGAWLATLTALEACPNCGDEGEEA